MSPAQPTVTATPAASPGGASPVPGVAVSSGEDRLGSLEREFRAFEARTEVVVSLLKWIGGFVVATLVAVVIQLISISFSAGKLQEKVDAHASAVVKLQDKIDAQTSVLQDLKAEVRELKAEIREARLRKP